MAVGGSKIAITLPQEQMTLSQQEILNWVKSAAHAVSNYYGHFPVPHLTLQIRAARNVLEGHITTEGAYVAGVASAQPPDQMAPTIMLAGMDVAASPGTPVGPMPNVARTLA